MFSAGSFPGSYELKALRNLHQGTWANIVQWWLFFSEVCLCWRNGKLTIHRDCVFPIIPNRGLPARHPSEQPPCFPEARPGDCMVNLLPLGDIFCNPPHWTVKPEFLCLATIPSDGGPDISKSIHSFCHSSGHLLFLVCARWWGCCPFRPSPSRLLPPGRHSPPGCHSLPGF